MDRHGRRPCQTRHSALSIHLELVLHVREVLRHSIIASFSANHGSDLYNEMQSFSCQMSKTVHATFDRSHNLTHTHTTNMYMWGHTQTYTRTGLAISSRFDEQMRQQLSYVLLCLYVCRNCEPKKNLCLGQCFLQTIKFDWICYQNVKSQHFASKYHIGYIYISQAEKTQQQNLTTGKFLLK